MEHGEVRVSTDGLAAWFITYFFSTKLFSVITIMLMELYVMVELRFVSLKINVLASFRHLPFSISPLTCHTL